MKPRYDYPTLFSESNGFDATKCPRDGSPIQSPFTASHIRNVQSLDPDTIIFPHELIATPWIASDCPHKSSPVCFPVLTSQRSNFLSAVPNTCTTHLAHVGCLRIGSPQLAQPMCIISEFLKHVRKDTYGIARNLDHGSRKGRERWRIILTVLSVAWLLFCSS